METDVILLLLRLHVCFIYYTSYDTSFSRILTLCDSDHITNLKILDHTCFLKTEFFIKTSKVGGLKDQVLTFQAFNDTQCSLKFPIDNSDLVANREGYTFFRLIKSTCFFSVLVTRILTLSI